LGGSEKTAFLMAIAILADVASTARILLATNFPKKEYQLLTDEFATARTFM